MLSGTSRCKTLRKFEIDKTRTAIYLLTLIVIVLSTTGSYSSFIEQEDDEESADKITVAPEPESFTAESDSLLPITEVNGEVQLRPYQLPLVPAEAIDSETLWLARCIYSETNRPEEQELIAWVVRNRVESNYRNKKTYRQVVLDPFQFSAFNQDSEKSTFYRALNLNHNHEGWKRALTIAYYVRHARPHYRPFSDQTLHFYSEQSMVGRKKPIWAKGLAPVETPQRYRLDERRFRFYEGIS